MLEYIAPATRMSNNIRKAVVKSGFHGRRAVLPGSEDVVRHEADVHH